MPKRFSQTLRQPLLWIGLIVGVSLAVGVHEWPYINWKKAVPPVDQLPLVIRQDAKGDGHFGSRRSGNRRHRGVDLTAPLNSPVRAIRSGTVVQVGSHRGLGNYVELEHKAGLHSLYAHLNDIQVEAGARVRQGEVLGTVGKTGNAKHPWIVPHVHLEMVKDNNPIDPALIGLRVADVRASAIPSVVGQDESLDAEGGE